MGSYLSEPVTEKLSSDEFNDKLNSGASSMQGWRVSQEDAHNCLLEFDVNTSLFAVYDGHGGHEVAHYCSQKLPQYIKDTEAYKNGNLEQALIDAFLGFDATIATREVVAELKQIAGVKEGENESDTSDVEENVSNLYEEATMPLEQVIEKYTSNLKHPNLQSLKDGEKQPVSPYLRARKDNSPVTNEACSSLGEGSSGSKNLGIEDVPDCGVSSSSNAKECIKDSSINIPQTSKNVEENGSSQVPEIQVHSADSSNDIKGTDKIVSKEDVVDVKANEGPNQNGEVKTSPIKKPEENTATPQENGEISKKGKGKASAKTKGVPATPPKKVRPKRNAQQLYSKLLEFESESESEDEEDKTFQGPNEESSSDEDGGKITGTKDDSEASSELEDEEDDEADELEEEDLDDIEEEEEDCSMDEADLDFARNMREEPGSDSGCTAVVCLLKGNELFVANAGDSRCIVCRNGKAIEMSIDHKPEDEQERERVVKAGGKVTADGRVNGGLNLSRAIGDHAYKQKKELSDREQMITALPDVRTLAINPGEDEFMVLACDGIWNFMSSQQVVDFVRPKIQESSEKLSKICEEMFDHCLAPNTRGDGTGCDNMTAIIVQFKTNLCKRAAPPEADESENLKRVKTDDVSQSEITA